MTLRLDRVSPAVRAKAAPFLEDLARVAGADLHSLHVVGSAVTPDWVEGRSDVNTLLVLREMDLAVLEAIGPLGKRHGARGSRRRWSWTRPTSSAPSTSSRWSSSSCG